MTSWWSNDKDPEDFLILAENLEAEDQTSRAEAVRYLIQRVKVASDALNAIEAFINSKESITPPEI